MKPFTPLEVAEILGGPIVHGVGESKRSDRVVAEREKIHARYVELFKPVTTPLTAALDVAAQARSEWVEKNLITDRAFLSIYSEGHGETVVGVFPTRDEASRAGKGKNWYGGDCDVEEHRVRGSVTYGQSSKAIKKS